MGKIQLEMRRSSAAQWKEGQVKLLKREGDLGYTIRKAALTKPIQ